MLQLRKMKPFLTDIIKQKLYNSNLLRTLHWVLSFSTPSSLHWSASFNKYKKHSLNLVSEDYKTWYSHYLFKVF